MTYFTESILFLWVVFWRFILCYFGVVYGGGGFSKYWQSPWCFWFFCVIVTSKSNCRRGETSLCTHATAICINAAQCSSFQRDNNLWPIDTTIKSSVLSFFIFPSVNPCTPSPLHLKARNLSSVVCVASDRVTTRPWSSTCGPTAGPLPTSATCAVSSAAAWSPCRDTWRTTKSRISPRAGASVTPTCTSRTSERHSIGSFSC